MQPIKITKLIIGSAGFALVITLITAALTVYGIIDTALARILLLCAWLIGVIGVVTSEIVRENPWKRVVLIGISFAVVFGGGLTWLDNWAVTKKNEQDVRAAPLPLPHWMLQPPPPPDIAFEKAPKHIIPTTDTGDIRAGNNSVIAPGTTQRSEGNLSPNIIGNNNRVGTVEVTSADPYAGTPNVTVASWAATESDRLDALGHQCGVDYYEAQNRVIKKIPNGPFEHSPAGVLLGFWMDYRSADESAIAKLQQSLDYRLGPVASASLDREYTVLQRSAADQEEVKPSRSSWLCMEVTVYAGELRTATARLDPTR